MLRYTGGMAVLRRPLLIALQAAEARPRPPQPSAHAHLPEALQVGLHEPDVLLARQVGVVGQRVEGGVVDGKQAAVGVRLEFVLLALRRLVPGSEQRGRGSTRLGFATIQVFRKPQADSVSSLGF